MTREQHLKLFISRYTNRNTGKVLASFREQYGNATLEEAFESWYKETILFKELVERVNKLERWLLRNGFTPVNSNISESRYYHINGLKLRFSSHIYPTGSMTDKMLKVYDLCADKHLVDDVIRILNVVL